MPGKLCRTWLFLVLLVSAPALAFGEKIRVSQQDGLYTLNGHFTTVAPPEVAWAVLTDYWQISRYKESAVIDSVAIQPTGEVWLFHQGTKLSLTLTENSSNLSVAFRDTLGKNFTNCDGSWRVISDLSPTTITYHLQARPRSWLPAFFIKRNMKGQATDTMAKLARAMDERIRGYSTSSPGIRLVPDANAEEKK